MDNSSSFLSRGTILAGVFAAAATFATMPYGLQTLIDMQPSMEPFRIDSTSRSILTAHALSNSQDAVKLPDGYEYFVQRCTTIQKRTLVTAYRLGTNFPLRDAPQIRFFVDGPAFRNIDDLLSPLYRCEA